MNFADDKYLAAMLLCLFLSYYLVRITELYTFCIYHGDAPETLWNGAMN
jgi:hypothetical protein